MLSILLKKVIAILTVSNIESVVQSPGLSKDTAKYLSLLYKSSEELQRMHIETKKLGDIDLPSGTVIAVDGLTLFRAEPFETKVRPGRYPVFIYSKVLEPDHKRVALAELRFSDKPAFYWKMATTARQDLRKITDGTFYGYGVDAGVGSFLSPEALMAYQKDMDEAEKEIPNFTDFYSDVLADEFESVYPNVMIYKCKCDPSHSVAIFHSGFGDGYYPSYFGYGKDGQPVKLVTTFFVLEEDEEQ